MTGEDIDGSTMATARAALRGAAAIAALGMTTACLPGSAEDEPTSGTPKGGQQLTEEQVQSVLPTAEQIPADLDVDGEATSDSSLVDPEATAYPSTCLDVQLGGDEREALEEHEIRTLARDYAGSHGGVITVRVTSHDVPVPETLFDDAGAAQATCTEFTKIDGDGTTKWRLEPATLPPLGDRTYAVGLEMLSGDELFVGGTIQLAGVAVGHNLVYIVYSAGPRSTLSTEAVGELAEITVANLEKT